MAVARHTRFPDAKPLKERSGSISLLSNGAEIWVNVSRSRVYPFNSKIALLRAFATQAAISIDKARISQELPAWRL